MSEKPTRPPAEKPDAAADCSQMPIEKCFEELERIVATLENQTTSLEDSLKLFERGMELSRRCSKELTTIERRIQMIIENSSGAVELQDFEVPDSAK